MGSTTKINQEYDHWKNWISLGLFDGVYPFLRIQKSFKSYIYIYNEENDDQPMPR
jgi:hypothetical protein